MLIQPFNKNDPVIWLPEATASSGFFVPSVLPEWAKLGEVHPNQTKNHGAHMEPVALIFDRENYVSQENTGEHLGLIIDIL